GRLKSLGSDPLGWGKGFEGTHRGSGPRMEAIPVLVAADGLPVQLQDVPWSFFMAFASLGLIFLLFRRRADLFSEVGFSGREVAFLTLGSIVGGTLVPLMLVGWWIHKRKLPILPTLVGTALVTLAAWRIVSFDPGTGIVARYPEFFLPVAVALVFALAVSFRKPSRGAPIAYACGTLGALIGADLLHVRDIASYFASASENTIISIGGAGVFDMVFLAGAFAMTLHLGAVVSMKRKPAADAPVAPPYPGPPLTLRDSRKVRESFLRVERPNGLERALAGIASSNLALKEGQFDRSVRMSWLAVDSLAREPAVAAWLGNGVPDPLKHDLALLRERSEAARDAPASLQDAGEANTTAKMLVAALAPRAGLAHHLEGVA